MHKITNLFSEIGRNKSFKKVTVVCYKTIGHKSNSEGATPLVLSASYALEQKELIHE